jgi:nucleoside 2-deoxyribosyltransferase
MKQMKQSKPLVYLSCALSHGPKDFLEDIAYLREQIQPYAEVLDFLGLHHPNVGDAFQYDVNSVRRCDVLIANATYPSIGLGLEFGVAHENRKPIITIVDDKLAPARLLIWGYWDPLHFRLRYKTREEAATFVIGKIQELFP